VNTHLKMGYAALIVRKANTWPNNRPVNNVVIIVYPVLKMMAK
jgi:hypothetical protein